MKHYLSIFAVWCILTEKQSSRPLSVSHVQALSTQLHSRVFVGTPTKPNQRLVRDYMTTNPKTLKTTDTVNEAIVALLAAGLNGAPVVDPLTNTLIGCVSAHDFVMMEETGAILPIDMLPTGGGGNEQQQDDGMQALRKIIATTVGELTTPQSALTIHVDTTMKEAAEILTKQRATHRLCVLDDAHQLVGILSTSDIMRNIVENVLQVLPESSSSSSSSSSVVDDDDTHMAATPTEVVSQQPTAVAAAMALAP